MEVFLASHKLPNDLYVTLERPKGDVLCSIFCGGYREELKLQDDGDIEVVLTDKTITKEKVIEVLSMCYGIPEEDIYVTDAPRYFSMKR